MAEDSVAVGAVAQVSDTGSVFADEDASPPSPRQNYAGAARTGLFEFSGGHDNPIDRDNSLPNRPCTAVISPQGRFSASDIFKALQDAEIDPESLGCMQRKSTGEVVLTFHTTTQKEQFLSKCSLTVNRRKLAIQDADHPLTFLNVYDAPHELPDTAIINRLAPFCEVLHHRRGKFLDPAGVFNGIRHYRVRVLHPIPSYLRFGKVLVALKHDGQQATCRHCNLPGHYANTCTNVACFNCGETGHQARTCPGPILCSLCRDPSHRARTCPYSWDRSIMRIRDANSDQEVEIQAAGLPPVPVSNTYTPLVETGSDPAVQATPPEQPNTGHDEEILEETGDVDLSSDDSSDSDDQATSTEQYTSAAEGVTSRATSPVREVPPSIPPVKAPEKPAKPKNGRNPATIIPVEIPLRTATRPSLPTGKKKDQPADIPSIQQLFDDTPENTPSQHSQVLSTPPPRIYIPN